MHHTVTLIAVNGITIARKKGRRSVLLWSLESHTTLKYSDLVLNISHWKDFLNSKDLSGQLYGKNGRKGTYLCLAVSGDCCCRAKGPKISAGDWKESLKEEGDAFSANKMFCYSSSFKNGRMSTISQQGGPSERNLSLLLLLVYSAISDKSSNSSVLLFIFVR